MSTNEWNEKIGLRADAQRGMPLFRRKKSAPVKNAGGAEFQRFNQAPEGVFPKEEGGKNSDEQAERGLSAPPHLELPPVPQYFLDAFKYR